MNTRNSDPCDIPQFRTFYKYQALELNNPPILNTFSARLGPNSKEFESLFWTALKLVYLCVYVWFLPISLPDKLTRRLGQRVDLYEWKLNLGFWRVLHWDFVIISFFFTQKKRSNPTPTIFKFWLCVYPVFPLVGLFKQLCWFDFAGV